jgi:uncharacterized membrane protein YcaP (DUF421 family)
MSQWIDVVYRSLIALSMLLIMTRLLGKKQLSQLNFFHYVTGITLGNIAGFISLEIDGHVMLGLTAMFIWGIVPILLEYLSLKSKTVRDWFEGRGIVLIKDGKVLEDNLKKARFSSDELVQELRKNNAFRIADVEFAVLETDGDVSVLLRKEHQPLTPSHLGIQVPNEQEPQTVIMDGKIMDEPLATMGLSRRWLHEELEKLGVTLENVFIGQVDAKKNLTVDLYDDQIKVPSPQKDKLLWALLKKCQADLELFALSSKNEEAKTLYDNAAMSMKNVVALTEPYLKR